MHHLRHGVRVVRLRVQRTRGLHPGALSRPMHLPGVPLPAPQARGRLPTAQLPSATRRRVLPGKDPQANGHLLTRVHLRGIHAHTQRAIHREGARM